MNVNPEDFNVVCFTRENTVRLWISGVRDKHELFSSLSDKAKSKFNVLNDFLMYNCFDRNDLKQAQEDYPDLNPTWVEFTGIDPLYMEKENVLTSFEFEQYVMNAEHELVSVSSFMNDISHMNRE